MLHNFCTLKRILPLAAMILFTSVTAMADAVTINGSLSTQDPTFNRPIQNGSALSGTLVPFDVYQFSVSSGGQYFLQAFPLAGTNPNNGGQATFGTFMALYQGSFDPTSPLTNFVAATMASGGGLGPAVFAPNLQANTPYFLIISSVNTPDYFQGEAPYRGGIQGAGMITLGGAATPTPEPATILLFGTGLASLAGVVRKGRSARTNV